LEENAAFMFRVKGYAKQDTSMKAGKINPALTCLSELLESLGGTMT
jgi:hypothetical protein